MSRLKKKQTDSHMHGQLRFKPMLKADLPIVHHLEKQCQAHAWPLSFFRAQLYTASCWVLLQDDRIIGFGIIRKVRSWAHIMNMCVAPDYRRQGLGRRIMLHLLETAKRQHATKAWLEVHISNQAAILLYRKLGFRNKKVLKRYYTTRRGREHALVMARNLHPTYPLKSTLSINDDRFKKELFY